MRSIDQLARTHQPEAAPRFAFARDFRPGSLDAGGFSELLGKTRAGAEASPADKEDKARQAAEQLVATALVQPVLKKLRESSLAAPPFVPSGGERQFQSIADAATAQSIVRAGNFPLVDRITELTLQRGRRTEVSA